MLKSRRLKAFTIIELLVTMTLTGILVSFAFIGYTQIQKLFMNYAVQSQFISDYHQLNKALSLLSNSAINIEQLDERTIVFNQDSSQTIFVVQEHEFLIKFKNHTDTFHFSPGVQHIKFMELQKNMATKLVKEFDSEIYFQNQKFHVSFHKWYDAATILNLTQKLLPEDELY